jgi:hypothetical protein
VKVYWEDGTRKISTEKEFHSVLDEVRGEGQPTMVFLEHDNGCSLVVGIGASQSVMTFADEFERTYHSVGDKTRTGMLLFRCRGQLDEFFEEMAVPEKAAIAAAWDFVETGNRPPGIEWEADW